MKTTFLRKWLGGTTNADNLPPSLRDAYDQLPENAPEPTHLDKHVFAGIVQGVISDLQAYDGIYQNSYHHLGHSLTVADRMRALFSIDTHPLNVEQAGILAALSHDLGHPGVTLRRDAHKSVQCPELGMGVTNEDVSGFLLDRYLEEWHVDVQTRVMAFILIQATTFGRPVLIITPLERMIALADIAPSKGLMEWIHESVDVLKESPIEKRPEDFDAWLRGRLGFLCFIRSRMTVAGAHLFWLGHLMEIERVLTMVLAGSDPVSKKMIEVVVTPHLQHA